MSTRKCVLLSVNKTCRLLELSKDDDAYAEELCRHVGGYFSLLPHKDQPSSLTAYANDNGLNDGLSANMWHGWLIEHGFMDYYGMTFVGDIVLTGGQTPTGRDRSVPASILTELELG